MYIIMYSVCHYIFYYMDGNWIVFSCLYSNQEIRLTDVPPILMATSSRHFFLAVLPQLHLFSLFLLIFLSLSLSHSPTPFPLPPSPVLDVFSPQQRRQFPYRITTRIRWPGFDSPSKPLHGKWKCIHVCWIERIAQMRAVCAPWKCSESAVCYCWQTSWVRDVKNIDLIHFFYGLLGKWNWILCDLHKGDKVKIERKPESIHESSDFMMKSCQCETNWNCYQWEFN